ncbi:MAG: Hsp20/alpha crystallin family protein [Arenicellales bacterium]|nr:Hsp20/alpha crystallin family protein [Arenicellales bacterium]
MGKSKKIKVKTKESFKEKISNLLEDMWDKIGQYHEGESRHPVDRPVAADADLSETENALNYNLELPGMDESDVEVAIDSGRLIVRGEKRDEREETGKNYIFRERRYGRFERSFVLPADVEHDKVKARFEKGVLKINVPYRATEGNVRKIKVT